MADRTPEDVATALTKAQRRCLRAVTEWADDLSDPLCAMDVDVRPRLALERRGLIQPNHVLTPTDLGRAVAAILRGEKADG